jgi:hypothetical protein
MVCLDNRDATRGCELLSGAVVVGDAERFLVGEAELSLMDAVAASRRSAMHRSFPSWLCQTIKVRTFRGYRDYRQWRSCDRCTRRLLYVG